MTIARRYTCVNLKNGQSLAEKIQQVGMCVFLGTVPFGSRWGTSLSTDRRTITHQIDDPGFKDRLEWSSSQVIKGSLIRHCRFKQLFKFGFPHARRYFGIPKSSYKTQCLSQRGELVEGLPTQSILRRYVRGVTSFFAYLGHGRSIEK